MKYFTTEDDSFLVHNLRKGNITAFNELFEKYSNRLYRFAWGYFKSDSEAEELVQDVFLIIWDKRETLDEKLSFKSYIFTIAFNNIKKHFRNKAQTISYLKSLEPNDIDLHTTHQITYDSLSQLVNELVLKLPEKRREIFIKSRLEGQSISEISDELKISHKTVENQLCHALKFMRKRLNAENVGQILIPLLIFTKSLS